MNPEQIAGLLADTRIDPGAREILAQAVAQAALCDGRFPPYPTARHLAAYREQDQRWQAAMEDLDMLLRDRVVSRNAA